MLVVVVIAEVTPDLTWRESVRVNVTVDRSISQGVQQGVEAILTRREPLTGEGQDLGRRDGPVHGARDGLGHIGVLRLRSRERDYLLTGTATR